MIKQKANTYLVDCGCEEGAFSDGSLFGNAFNYAAIGMAIVAPDGKWLKVNKSLCHIVGYSEPELLKMSFQDITHSDDLNTDLEYVRRMLAKEINSYQMEKRYIKKGGAIVWILLSVSLVFDEKDAPIFFISQIQDITKVKSYEHELVRLISEDHLTKIGSRRYFFEQASREIKRSARSNEPISLIMVDVDNFKNINDCYGHDVGDIVLYKIADVCKKAIRSIDVVARLGGEEFSILLLDTDREMCRIIAERLLRRISNLEIKTANKMIQVTVSLGVVSFVGDKKSIEFRLKQADDALYQAKKFGKNRVEYYIDKDSAEVKAEPVRTGFVRLVWQNTYKSGNLTIDTQHQELFLLANDLLEAVLAGLNKDTCLELIDNLCEHLIVHFSDEESIFVNTTFKYSDAHIKLHSNLLQSIANIKDKYVNDKLSAGELFSFISIDVILNHMINEDRAFFQDIKNTLQS